MQISWVTLSWCNNPPGPTKMCQPPASWVRGTRSREGCKSTPEMRQQVMTLPSASSWLLGNPNTGWRISRDRLRGHVKSTPTIKMDWRSSMKLSTFVIRWVEGEYQARCPKLSNERGYWFCSKTNWRHYLNSLLSFWGTGSVTLLEGKLHWS